MTVTITHIYDDYISANDVVKELERAGFQAIRLALPDAGRRVSRVTRMPRAQRRERRLAARRGWRGAACSWA